MLRSCQMHRNWGKFSQASHEIASIVLYAEHLMGLLLLLSLCSLRDLLGITPIPERAEGDACSSTAGMQRCALPAYCLVVGLLRLIPTQGRFCLPFLPFLAGKKFDLASTHTQVFQTLKVIAHMSSLMQRMRNEDAQGLS